MVIVADQLVASHLALCPCFLFLSVISAAASGENVRALAESYNPSKIGCNFGELKFWTF